MESNGNIIGMSEMEIEVQKLDRAGNLHDLKNVMRDHMVLDSQRFERVMGTLEPISKAFQEAGGFRRIVISIGLTVSFFLTAIWMSLQIYFKVK